MDSFEMLRQLQRSALEQSRLLEHWKFLQPSVFPDRALLDALRGASIPSTLDTKILQDFVLGYERQRTLGLDLASMLPPPSALERAGARGSMTSLTNEQKLWEGIAKGLAASRLTVPQSLSAMIPGTVWESSMRTSWRGSRA
jgi:hypothetical protein